MTLSREEIVDHIVPVWLCGREPDMQSTYCGLKFRPPRCRVQQWASCLQTCLCHQAMLWDPLASVY